MKKVVAALLVLTAASAGSAEVPQKDLCLLEGAGCPSRQFTLQEMIGRLQRELALGERVYSPEELRKLQAKLEEYEFYLWMVQRPSGS